MKRKINIALFSLNRLIVIDYLNQLAMLIDYEDKHFDAY